MSLREADRPGARIAIVGGGLSGLYAAWLLAERGIRDWVLFEARSTLGGRILSIPVAGSGDGSATAASTARSRFDLGPAWFWPSIQGDLSRLIDTLGLARFAQFESGDMMYERTTDEPPVRVRGFVSSPVGMRLAGGTSSLIDALHGQLERERILCQTAVRIIRQAGDRLELDSRHASGATTTWRVQHVLLAGRLLLVALLEIAGHGLVVALDGVPRRVGDAAFHQLGGGAQQGVAVLDAALQEGAGAAGLDGFQRNFR